MTAFWFIGLLFLVLTVACEARLSYRLLVVAVTKGTRQRTRKIVDEGPALYDEYGAIPQVQNVYRGIGKGRSVIVFRTNNSTVVAIGPRPEANDNTLVIKSGCNPFYELTSPVCDVTDGGPRHSILVTGAAGDCRTVVRFAKQLVLNYTMEYSASPSGGFVAERVGAFLQGRLGGGSRMLACHCFVLSTPAQSGNRSKSAMADSGDCATTGSRHNHSSCGAQGTIFEVTAVGGVAQVAGGVAGGPSVHRARQLLQRGLACPGAVNGTQLTREVLQAAMKSGNVDTEGGSGGGFGPVGDTGSGGIGACSIFEIPDLYRQ